MRTMRLDGSQWDAVMAADAISYTLTETDLAAAFASAFAHLKPGGVFCTYAEATRERFIQNKSHCWTTTQGDLAITFLENEFDPDETDTTYDYTLVYLIHQGSQLRVETDRHLNGLFELGTWHRLLQEVGFQVTRVEFQETGEDSLPMFVCRKP